MKLSIFKFLSVSGICLLLFSCAPQVRESDDEDHAWARQVVPILYGRQPRGQVEVRVIADMVQRFGRRNTAERMMRRSEFRQHWGNIILDLYRAPKDGAKSLAACMGEPLRNQPEASNLAQWTVSRSANTGDLPPGGDFNLADLLLSSLKLDDLSPYLRAHLFAMNSKPLTGNQITEVNQRQDLYTNFESNFLGRDSGCLICHNAAWSTTDKFSGWNRSHAILGYFERSLQGTHAGLSNPKLGQAMFRVCGVNPAASSTQGFDICSDSVNARMPWNGLAQCGTFGSAGSDDPLLSNSEEAFMAGDRGKRASLYTVEEIFKNGVDSLRDGLDRTVSPGDVAACEVCESAQVCSQSNGAPNLTNTQQAQETAALNAIIGAGCLNCHREGEFASGFLTLSDDPATWKDQLVRVQSGRDGSSRARVHPGDASNSFIIDALTQSVTTGYPMPGGANIAPTISTWINNMPSSSGCNTCRENSRVSSCPAPAATVPGDEAFAFLVAMNFTDKVWREVMGYPLTIAHGYSRNMEQRNLHWHLTEIQFVNHDWSLKKLLSFILASDYMNRKPPADGDGKVKPSGDESPYELPMFFDPWVEQDPREQPMADANGNPNPNYDPLAHPDKHKNAMSEAIHRKSAKTLLQSASSALGWPEPKRIPNNGFPSKNLAIAIGQFSKDSVPGFRSENLSSFMTWETNVATCNSPTVPSNDWIDQLTQKIQQHNTNNPQDPVSVIQAAEIVKDWILADGRMSNSEKSAVAALMKGGQNASATSLSNLQASLRDYCGVLLNSPQFKLAGFAREGVGPEPKIRVCNGANCSYKQICQEYIPATSRSIFRPFGVNNSPRCTTNGIRSNGFATLNPDIVLDPSVRIQPLTTSLLLEQPILIESLVRPDVTNININSIELADKPELIGNRVKRAKGVAVLTKESFVILKPGMMVPRKGLILSEKGSVLESSDVRGANRNTTLFSMLPKGGNQQLAEQFKDASPSLRAKAIDSIRKGLPISKMVAPGYATFKTPVGAVNATLSGARPYGSAGRPITPEEMERQSGVGRERR